MLSPAHSFTGQGLVSLTKKVPEATSWNLRDASDGRKVQSEHATSMPKRSVQARCTGGHILPKDAFLRRVAFNAKWTESRTFVAFEIMWRGKYRY